MLYRIRIDCPWRDLPAVFGKPNSIFKKFTRWCKDSKLIKIFKLLSNDADLEQTFIDASHVRVHKHAIEIKDQNIAKSTARNSSTIYLTGAASGNPIEFIIGDSTTHEVKVATDLIECLDLKRIEILCADKDYNSEVLRKKSIKLEPMQIFQRNPIQSPRMSIWIGIHIKLGTELKMYLHD